MSMTLKPRRIDDVVILDLSGRITIGEGTVVLRNHIQKLLDAGELKFLLNLADVDYIDSSGLGELVTSFTTIRNKNGQLKLLNLTRRVHDLLGLHPVRPQARAGCAGYGLGTARCASRLGLAKSGPHASSAGDGGSRAGT